MSILFAKAGALCLLSIIALFAVGIASGSTIKGLWNLITRGTVKEFLTSEGRFCLLIGALFGIFLLLYVFTPDLISHIARMLDPDNFAPPKEAPPLVFWLLFLYFLGNIIIVGLLYKKNGK